MSPIDAQLIARKGKLIEEDLQKLSFYASLTEKEYRSKEEAQLAAERLLERIVGRLIDINYHILKETYQTMPLDYYDSFLALAKQRLVSEQEAREVAKATGLRNILAHEYDEVDPGKVYQAIRFALEQIPHYLTSIMKKLGI
ncbi:MAG: HepT-like ribonuclease domain-containing protein [Patescibacteria group bacterium]